MATTVAQTTNYHYNISQLANRSSTNKEKQIQDALNNFLTLLSDNNLNTQDYIKVLCSKKQTTSICILKMLIHRCIVTFQKKNYNIINRYNLDQNLIYTLISDTPPEITTAFDNYHTENQEAMRGSSWWGFQSSNIYNIPKLIDFADIRLQEILNQHSNYFPQIGQTNSGDDEEKTNDIQAPTVQRITPDIQKKIILQTEVEALTRHGTQDKQQRIEYLFNLITNSLTINKDGTINVELLDQFITLYKLQESCTALDLLHYKLCSFSDFVNSNTDLKLKEYNKSNPITWNEGHKLYIKIEKNNSHELINNKVKFGNFKGSGWSKNNYNPNSSGWSSDKNITLIKAQINGYIDNLNKQIDEFNSMNDESQNKSNEIKKISEELITTNDVSLNMQQKNKN